MQVYRAPVSDLRFVLRDVLDIETAYRDLPGGEMVEPETLDAVLEEFGRIAEEVIFPTNIAGDRDGCTYANGTVTTPEGFKEAYQALVDGGWIGLSGPAEHGGQGMPNIVSAAIDEMLGSANLSLSAYVKLSKGAVSSIAAEAPKELADAYLPNIVSGVWPAVMCLTEPHCGTDLGMLKTRAEPAGDGTYRITGTKIFITGGEHDMAENIIHLVLAKLPDAPAGTRGISLFLVPKFLPGADGGPGERNGFRCGGIEKKMGLSGSATCVMNYDGARAWMIGEPHRGLPAMFHMMNHVRLSVGQEGVGIGEPSYQSAAAYALDRVQGRAPGEPANPDGPADPIIHHPDVRRMLMRIRATTEACRALILYCWMQFDRRLGHPDPEVRARAGRIEMLLTPVAKAFVTDRGFDSAVLAQQVFGGHGYIKDNGVEQFVRDVRISKVYEGANGIHALDLAGRKLSMDGGQALHDYLDEIRAFIEGHEGTEEMAEFVEPLGLAADRVDAAAAYIRRGASHDPAEIGAASYDFLTLMGLTASAHMMAMSAAAVFAAGGPDTSPFHTAKLETARFFMTRILPETAGLAEMVHAGAGSVMALPPEAFATG